MQPLAPDAIRFVKEAPERVREIGGLISSREIRFLALMGATRTATGEVLEIGSYQGRSTVAVGLAAKLAGDQRMAAVDPLSSDYHVQKAVECGGISPRQVFDANLARAGLHAFVEFHQMSSQELGPHWNRPLRLLWIDGDHSYEGTKADFEWFSPWLSDGAIIAIHDTINCFEGSLRVFMEDILLSPHFGPAGLVGSISWARYFKDPERTRSYQSAKLRLYRRLSRLAPYVAFDNVPQGWRRKAFMLRRWRVPHAELPPDEWLKQVA